MTMYSDSGYSTSVLSTPENLTNCAGISDLRYFAIRNSHYNYGSDITGTIDDIQIYDGVTSVSDTFCTNDAPTTSDLEKAARTEPNDFRKQVDLARHYESSSRFEDAKEIYLRLAAQHSYNADAHFHLGSFYARFGQMKKALDSFDEALDVQVNHRATIEAMATLFGSTETRAFSDDILAKSAEKDPRGPAQRMQTIRKSLDEKNFEYAAKLAQGGQEMFPRNSGFIFLKGLAFQGMGDMDKAKSSYQESIKKDPTHHESYVALGDL